ncbi:MAG: hypothetical protein CL610_28525 [Anaerolineaceae bacterium]|nr:hypothetical protein [Anaerolineaceae bacterium]
MADLPIMAFADAQAWEAWLDDHHLEAPGIWMKFAKKGTGVQTVNYAEGVEVALCFGWIDGQARKLDDTYWLQRFTPRRRRSMWSQINVGRAEAMIEQGRMRPRGLEEIERAKADGRWDAAYPSPANATVPDDLQQALDQNPEAKAFFEQLTSGNRFAILNRISMAKKPETRQKRIDQFIVMLNEKKTIY